MASVYSLDWSSSSQRVIDLDYSDQQLSSIRGSQILPFPLMCPLTPRITTPDYCRLLRAGMCGSAMGGYGSLNPGDG